MERDLESRLKAADELVAEQSLCELVELLWSTDRRCTFPSFQATARHVGERLREWGVRSRTFELPADGRTLLADWKAPLGWDCAEAHLEIHEPLEERGQRLADFKKQPAHLIRWSGPTPPQGLTAEIVRVASAEDLAGGGDAVRNKIVYTPADPRPFKKQLAEAGALAVVTSYCPQAHHLARECGWVGAWSDDPRGWAFHDGDAPLPGMVISPEAGVELEVLLDRGRVKLRMHVDSRYFETHLPVICGYMDAEMQEEVLAVAPAFGVGANDAAGAAVVLESLRVLHEASASGQRPLRRAVRGLLVHPGCGMIGFAALNQGITHRIHAGVNWRNVGRYHEAADAVFRYHRCPDAAASVADTLLGLLLEAWLPKALPYLRLAAEEPYAPFENACSDPRIGIPCPVVAGHDRFAATSADTPKDLSPAALRAFAAISVAYLHFLATATGKEAYWLAHQTVRRHMRRLEDLAGQYAVQLDQAGADKPALLARAFDHLTYARDICELAVMSAKRFMLREERHSAHQGLLRLLRHTRRLLDVEKRRLKDLAGVAEGELPKPDALGEVAALRPYKTFLGTPTYAGVATAEKAALSPPACDAPLHAALFWADGNHTFAEIVRRVGHEYPAAQAAALAQHFRFMGAHGLVRWLEPGEAVPKHARREGHEAAEESSPEATPPDAPPAAEPTEA